MSNPAIPAHLDPRRAQPIDRMMQAIDERLAGFNLFGGAPEELPKVSEDELQAQRDASEVFGTEAGVRLLEYLADRSVRCASVVDPLSVDPVRGWALNQRCEGRNDLFFLILALIAAARDEPAPRRDGPQT